MRKIMIALLFLLIPQAQAGFIAKAGGGSGAATWGTITGTLSSQTDLNTALGLKATLASPTFSGTIGTPLTHSACLVTDSSGNLAASTTTSTELGFVHGLTSAVQTQLNALAPTASPTFTGTITTPVTASTAVISDGSNHLAASSTTSTELGYVHGVTSALQTQVDAKLPLAGGTMTGVVSNLVGQQTSGNAGTALTGTVSSTTSTTVTGSGTSFTTQVAVGDYLTFPACNGSPWPVSAVNSNTSLTGTFPSGCPNGNAINIVHPIAKYFDYSGALTWTIHPDGTLLYGQTVYQGANAYSPTSVSGIRASQGRNFVIGTDRSFVAQGLWFAADGSGLWYGSSQEVDLKTAGLVVKTAVSTPVFTYTPSGTTQTVDWTKSNYIILDLSSATGGVTVTWSSQNSGERLRLEVKQGSTPRTVTINSTKYPGGTAYTATNSASAIDLLTCDYDGTNTLCTYDLNFS